MSQAEVIDDREEIEAALLDVEVGDEITVETILDQRHNREVTDTSGNRLVLGDPSFGIAWLVDPERCTLHDFPENAFDEDVSGTEIRKLWVF